MKVSDYQQDVLGTSAWMKKIMEAIKWYVQMSSNDTLFADRLFSGVETAYEENSDWVDYFRPDETSHKGFCLATLEKLMK